LSITVNISQEIVNAIFNRGKFHIHSNNMPLTSHIENLIGFLKKSSHK